MSIMPLRYSNELWLGITIMRMKQNLCVFVLSLLCVFSAACGFINYFTAPLAPDRKVSDFYYSNKADLKKLEAMLREDLQNLSAVSQLSQYRSLYFYKGCVEQRKCDQYKFVEKGNLSEARKNAYYDILSKIQGFENLSAENGYMTPFTMNLDISSAQIKRSPSIWCHKGIYFSDKQPAQITNWSLDWNDCSSLAIYRDGSYIYRPLDGSWYMYLMGVNTEDLP
jgi:hypothetical protein